jgi:hypothetical protein
LHPTSSDNPDTYCNVCHKDLTDHWDQHLKSGDHQTAESAANDYLKFCKEGKLNPVSCSREELTDLLKKFSKKTVEVLEVVDRLHDPLDCEPILKNSNFQKLFGIVQKIRNQKSSSDLSSSSSSRKRKISETSDESEMLASKRRRSSETGTGSGNINRNRNSTETGNRNSMESGTRNRNSTETAAGNICKRRGTTCKGKNKT